MRLDNSVTITVKFGNADIAIVEKMVRERDFLITLEDGEAAIFLDEVERIEINGDVIYEA